MFLFEKRFVPEVRQSKSSSQAIPIIAPFLHRMGADTKTETNEKIDKQFTSFLSG